MIGRNAFSVLAPVLGPQKKMALSPSATVHGGQYDTNYQVCDIRVANACGIRG